MESYIINELTHHFHFLFYASENGSTKVQVIVEDETVWATQATISDVFNTSRTSIVEHIKNIYSSNELDENSTCRKIRHVANEGENRESKYTKQIIKNVYFF